MDTAPNLGFLTVVQEGGGYYGAYLVTNGWGRPLEFRLSSVVQPNRVQQLLYGPTLLPYLCADLIGKTLIDKCATVAQLILTDCDAALDARLHFSIPVAWIAPLGDPAAASLEQNGAGIHRTAAHQIVCHRRFPGDLAVARNLLAEVDIPDLAEPFVRVRDALTEARKLGATHRAA